MEFTICFLIIFRIMLQEIINLKVVIIGHLQLLVAAAIASGDAFVVGKLPTTIASPDAFVVQALVVVSGHAYI